jgi:hypothetical protein
LARKPVSGLVYQEDIERWISGALGMQSLSLKRIREKGLWGGLLYLETRKIYYVLVCN